ncbi:MAG TPA: TIGR03435 family protein [Acidobacteriaceae bacterium]|nr:TIGR03435 family protein [Acidobacteriaceae bacterium]
MAAAQAQKEHNATSTTSQKQFAFEVVAIHPLKPGFSEYDQAPAPLENRTPSPSGFSSTMLPGDMVRVAYGEHTPIDNMPDWFKTWYSINARVAETDIAAWQRQSGKHELLSLAMQAMLRDRFKLAVHQEPFKKSEYALVVRKKGVRFKPSLPGAVLPQGLALPSGGVRTLDEAGVGANGLRLIKKVHFYGATMADLTDFLKGNNAGRPIEDVTGLTGHYDFTLERDPQPENPVSLFPVEPLGLTLKSVMAPSYKVVIDHVERPSPN